MAIFVPEKYKIWAETGRNLGPRWPKFQPKGDHFWASFGPNVDLTPNYGPNVAKGWAESERNLGPSWPKFGRRLAEILGKEGGGVGKGASAPGGGGCRRALWRPDLQGRTEIPTYYPSPHDDRATDSGRGTDLDPTVKHDFGGFRVTENIPLGNGTAKQISGCTGPHASLTPGRGRGGIKAWLAPTARGNCFLRGETGAVVPLLTSAASAPRRPSHAGAGNAAHKVSSKTVKLGGCSPPPMMWKM